MAKIDNYIEKQKYIEVNGKKHKLVEINGKPYYYELDEEEKEIDKNQNDNTRSPHL